MIAELALANAAFATIKATLANGRELLDAGKAVGDYFGAASAISKEVATKGKNSALEAYQAQQQMMRQEEELKHLLNSQSMMGYFDFLEFKAKFARDQKEAARLVTKKKYQRQQAVEDALTLGIKVMLGLLATIATLFGAIIYLR